ncbi:MAG: hypothetical protein ACYTG7_25195, partial [Planctomycetota bacterium]
MKRRSLNWFPWFVAIILALGASGFAIGAFRDIKDALLVKAKGEHWEGRDSEGRIKSFALTTYLHLRENESLEIKPELEGTFSLSLTAERQSDAAFFELIFREGDSEAFSLVLDKANRYGMVIATGDREGEVTVLAQRKDREFMSLPTKKMTVQVSVENQRLSLGVNGEKVFEEEAIPWSGGRLSLTSRAGRSRIEQFVFHGTCPEGRDAPAEIRIEENFSSLPVVSPWPEFLGELAVALLYILGLGFFLRSFCLGRPGRRDYFRATALLFFPPSFYYLGGWLGPIHERAWLLYLLFPLGFFSGIFILRKKIRTPEDGTTLDRLRPAFISLILILATLWTVSDYRVRFFARSLEAEQAAQARASSAPYELEEPVRLG